MKTIDDLIDSEGFRRFFLPLASLALIALFVSLGLWQLDRAAEKRALQALFRDDAPIVAVTGDTPLSEFQPIEAAGRYLAERQVLIDRVIVDGRPGVYVITPFQLASGRPLLLVNRGFVAHATGDGGTPDLELDTGPRSIRGRVGFLPRVGIRRGPAFRDGDAWPRWASYPTFEELAGALEARLLPFVLLLDPAESDGFLRHWQPTARGPGMHYGYAAQWFAMAAAVAGILGWRWRKKRG